jgi:hypothetical protein
MRVLIIIRGLCLPAVLLALVFAPPTRAGSEADPACPPNLRAWRAAGSAEPGGEWAARFLEIRGDVGILRELVVRFGSGALRPDEAKWFDAPIVLEPIRFHTRTLSFVDQELSAVCGHLSDSQIAELRERAKPRCYVDDSGNRMLVKSQLTLTDSGLESSWQFSSGGIGLVVSEETDFDENNLPCESLENLETSIDGAESSDRARWSRSQLSSMSWTREMLRSSPAWPRFHPHDTYSPFSASTTTNAFRRTCRPSSI